MFKITHVTQGCFAMLVSGIFNNQSGNHPVADERGTSWGGKDRKDRKEKLQKRKKERLFFPKLTGILDKFSSWSCLLSAGKVLGKKNHKQKKHQVGRNRKSRFQNGRQRERDRERGKNYFIYNNLGFCYRVSFPQSEAKVSKVLIFKGKDIRYSIFDIEHIYSYYKNK